MRAATLDEFAREPVNRFVAGGTFVHFCASPELWGLLLWGRPDGAAARELGRSLILELGPPAVPHASLVDASRLEHGERDSFRALERYMTDFAEPLSRQVHRLALVRPPGVTGALVAGIYDVVPRPYPVRVFDALGTAIEWLALEGSIGLPVAVAVGTVEALHEQATGALPILGKLRALLESRLGGTDLSEAAKALGTSDRSLQRRLREAETTFSAELAAARVRVAQRRLLSTDRPLTDIALEVGCASLQHFGVVFRRVTGESPSAWRDRERARRAAPGKR